MRRWLFFLMFVSFMACEPDDLCLENPQINAVMRFHNALTGEPEAVDSVAVFFDGKKIIPATQTDSLALPLPTDRDTAQFVFEKTEQPSGNFDTLVLIYKRNDVFVSKACGFRMTYSDLHAFLITDSNNWIHHVSVTRTQITDDTLAHIRIYY